MGGLLQLFTASKYSIYVLFLLLLSYLLNQLDRYTVGVTSIPMAQDIHFGDKGCLPLNNETSKAIYDKCRFKTSKKDKIERDRKICLNKTNTDGIRICRLDYDGTGEEYQILAGPAFIVVYTISGVPLGLLGNYIKRTTVLGTCLMVWSAMTLLTGFSKKYWHLVLTRFITGIGEAGCTPFATSLIGDFFSEDLRGAALGVYNWGIYFGYSLSYALGNFIAQANINGQGWRWVYYIAGMPGLLIGPLIMLSIKEPKPNKDRLEVSSASSKSQLDLKTTLLLLCKTFFRPSSLILFLAGAIRNGGGYVWAYNTQPYFNNYYPDVNVGKYMSWIPLVSGSFGVVLGGFISDRIVKRRGPHARIWVLVFSQVSYMRHTMFTQSGAPGCVISSSGFSRWPTMLLAAPFAAGALFLKPPYAFISLIPSNVFGEMWIGVTLAVVIELVPSAVRTASIAWYLFLITIIGGNMPLLVPPISNITSLRTALYIMYPGMYLLGSVLFFFALFVLERDIKRREKLDKECSKMTSVSEEEKQPILGANSEIDGSFSSAEVGGIKRD